MYTHLFRTCQVSSATQQPLGQISHEEIKKNSIIAVYAEDDEDNHGLPFFLGKVLSVSNKNEKERDDDEDDDESDEAPEYLVEIHEYIQTENNDGEPSGKYQLHNVDGERKKLKGSKATTAKADTSKVPIGQIALVPVNEKMNGNTSLPKATMKFLSYVK